MATARRRRRRWRGRGYGARRVAAALTQAKLGEDDRAELQPAIDDRAEAAALAFARRKRIGPFASAPADRPLRERQLAAMLRAGHDFATARRILAMAPGQETNVSFGDDDIISPCEADAAC